MRPRRTLILTRRDLTGLIDLAELVDGLRAAYIVAASEREVRPQRVAARLDDSSLVFNFPGALPSYDTYTVKLNVKTPGNVAIGLPFLLGTILLLERATGYPLAVLESGLITAMRTGAAGALGVLTLAQPKTNVVAVIGAGVQCEWQLRALLATGSLDHVRVYDLVPERAEAFALRLTPELALPIVPQRSLEEAVSGADIVVTATQSREAFITPELVRPGMHINAFGADEPGKVEIDPAVLNSSFVVVDDREIALNNGALNVAQAQGQLHEKVIQAELGEILNGQRPGRTSPEQVTLFANTGLAFQDLVACHLAYERAVAVGIGTWIDFL